MHKRLFSVALALVMFVTAGCGLIESLTGGGSAQTTTLWADVPRMEGMQQENMQLPLPVRLAVQALIQSSAASEGVRVDNFEIVSFTSAKTAEDVKAFYTNERMQAAGWNIPNQPGCSGMNDEAASAGVAFCMFGKQNPTNKSFLVIAAMRNENETATTVYFLRFDGDLTATPSGS
ncbi:MAG: hypothetical protein NZM18_03855 [Thermoflexales bacterium]|nr:hypothetical protein [Thermoflexales bacterium]MDW8350730.1 hypothetical protein [Anaerolineae bacterium]